MLLTKNQKSRKMFSRVCTLLLCAGFMPQVKALDNASFEEPFIPDFDITQIDLELFNPGNELLLRFAIGLQLTETDIPGWVQTGDVRINTGGAISDTGIFSNQDVPELGVVGIENLDGVQLGFLVVNTLADGVTEDFVSVYQATGDTFAANEDYIFQLEVGNSVSLAGSDRTPLQLSIGYIDDTPGLVGSEIFKAVETLELLYSDLDTSGSGALTDQTVQLLAGDLDPLLLGKQIAIQALIAVPDDLTELEKTNIEGAYNIDNARFTVVPEPTSLVLLGAGGLLFLRRRR